MTWHLFTPAVFLAEIVQHWMLYLYIYIALSDV